MADSEIWEQLGQIVKEMLPGRKPRKDRVYTSNARRQAAYRLRKTMLKQQEVLGAALYECAALGDRTAALILNDWCVTDEDTETVLIAVLQRRAAELKEQREKAADEWRAMMDSLMAEAVGVMTQGQPPITPS